jgi:glycerol-3-phosphate dehydrogenase
MWHTSWRDNVWDQIPQRWDMIIIGGGITGAGILREATYFGLKALLIEQRDFAWGTSSRSSKLVHGGLRYLREGKILLTRASVQEREHLLKNGPGLIDPLGFLLSVYEDDFPGRWTYELGLSVYDLLALRWDHKFYSSHEYKLLAPHINDKNLLGGFYYGDAQTDDARLTLRVIREAVVDGGVAINYVKATSIIKDDTKCIGVKLQDLVSDRTIDAYASVVINATGAWSDYLREQLGSQPQIRPLRGSHLLLPAWRLPVAQSVSFLHPIDRRPVFIFPWETVTLVGTTDVDHDHPLNDEPRISPEEFAYLMAAIEFQYPSLRITPEDITSTFAGVRPVIHSGEEDPSQESRDHVVWEENGLLTVTGGKLTTFRLIAQDAINAVRHHLVDFPEMDRSFPMLKSLPHQLPGTEHLSKSTRTRILGRYGIDALHLVSGAKPGELEFIPTTNTLWAELRWAARDEGVVHLDDLLLRRTRIGLVLPNGGVGILPSIQLICMEELGWDHNHWETECIAYMKLWNKCYSVPDLDKVPDWNAMLKEAMVSRQKKVHLRRRKTRRTILTGLITTSVVFLIVWYLQQRQSDS